MKFVVRHSETRIFFSLAFFFLSDAFFEKVHSQLHPLQQHSIAKDRREP